MFLPALAHMCIINSSVNTGAGLLVFLGRTGSDTKASPTFHPIWFVYCLSGGIGASALDTVALKLP